ncbi:MAG: hypothetical protein ACYC6L_08920 [Anaerolineae bacterium]
MTKCTRCGTEVEGQAIFCPRCGKRLPVEVTPPAQPETLPESEQVNAHEQAGTLAGHTEARRSNHLTILAGLLAVLALAGIVLLVVGAITSGLKERQKVTLLEAEQHYEIGLARIDAGEYRLAIAEFEVALRLNPKLKEAQSGIDQANARLNEKVTPVIQPTITPVAISDELDAVQQAYIAEDWDQVVLLGNQFISNYPNEHNTDISGMLYDAYIAKASAAVAQGLLGDAVRYLDQALQLVPGDETATQMREKAVLYQEGSSLFGADWEGAISVFEQLVAIDGNYIDVYAKLYQAHLGYAAEAADGGSWCVAAQQYAAANALIADDSVATLQANAEAACQNAPTDQPPMAPGTFVGQVVKTDSAANNLIYIGGYVLDSASKGVKAVRVKISAYDWSAVATTDSGGHYSFDGLTTPVTYTLTLLDVTAVPIDVEGKLGQFSQVNFVQAAENQ